MRKLVHIVMALVVFGGLSAMMSSCYKVKDTTVEVFVQNETGSPVPGASVRLFGESTLHNDDVGEIIHDRTEYTDADGRAFFDYTDFFEAGQAGFAVLSVEIQKPLPPPEDDLFLESIIKIQEETNNIEVYVLE